MKHLVLLILACWMMPAPCTGQGNGSPFNIYFFRAFYSDKVSGHLLQNGFQEAHMLTYLQIDPDKDQQVNADAVRKYTAGFYPDKDATGLYIIDWEAKAFDDLKKYDAGSDRFKAAEQTFIQLVKLVKEYRPRLSVAIYGLPFRFFYPSQRKATDTDKLDNLLSHCDVLTPSFYILYTDEQIGQNRNLDYLRQNMDQALKLGTRLKKPVAPFFWYKVNPGNRMAGMKVMSKDKMGKYLELLRSYNYQGNKLDGIVWWEGGEKIAPKQDANRQVRAFSSQGAASPAGGSETRDSIIMNYTMPFQKKKQ